MKITALLLNRVLMICFMVGAGFSYGANDSNTKIKAAILFKITHFVHWPEGKVSDKKLDLCVLGDNSLYKELKTTEGKRSKGFQIRVPDQAKFKNTFADCEMLYLGSDGPASIQKVANEVSNQSILLVSDLPDFAHQGGMIQLRERGGRFRFIINLQTAKHSGLDISSQLLGLAKVIK